VRFYRNSEVEERAVQRLGELEQLLGRPLTPPIPIDLIAEKLLGLDFLWEPIKELPGETILGALRPDDRQVVLNEKHVALFREKPGLERSTKGHEMGHWDLFLAALVSDHPSLFELADNPRVAYRSAAAGEVVVIKALMGSSEGWELLRQLKSRADHPHEAHAVNRYAAALSMPRELVVREAMAIDRTSWRALYELAERFDVTISALKVRLEELDLLRVSKDGKLYGSSAEACGQRSLF
jgi:hypothetical protein